MNKTTKILSGIMLTTVLIGGITATAVATRPLAVKSSDTVSVADFNTFMADKNTVDINQNDRISKVEDKMAISSSSVASSVIVDPVKSVDPIVVVVQQPVSVPASSVANSVSSPAVVYTYTVRYVLDSGSKSFKACNQILMYNSSGCASYINNYNSVTPYKFFSLVGVLSSDNSPGKIELYAIKSINPFVGDKMSDEEMASYLLKLQALKSN